MTHPVDELAAEAEVAIARMKTAALEARYLHARAELARHMRTTANRMIALPVEEAAARISAEWMKAWALDSEAYPAIAGQVAGFTMAFCLDARGSTPDTRAAIHQALERLEAGFAVMDTTLSDEMAFRSECAHGWWNGVVPIPAALRQAERFRLMPRAGDDQPWWTASARPHCL